MEVLTAEQMSIADKKTIEELKVPSIVLMENAARSVFGVFTKLKISKNNIAVVIGKGNNGGDGLALCRYLLDYGYNVRIYMLTDKDSLRGDPLINHNILTKYPAKIIYLNKNSFKEADFTNYDVIFDAVFGTGLNKPVEGFFKEVIKSINLSGATIIAIDIPSGLSGSTFNIIGEHVKADYTVTFCRPKTSHVMYPARKFCGKIYVTDISIPDFVVNETKSRMSLITLDNLPHLKLRATDSHKGNFGHAVIIGGSIGKTGAPIMSSMAAARIGAGLTTCIIPGKLNSIFESNLLEAMSFPAGDDYYFKEEDVSVVLKFLENKNVVAIGPGIGRNEDTQLFIKKILSLNNIPLIIDADGLYKIDKNILESGLLSNRTVITPHIGEFARLIGRDKNEVLNNRLALAEDFACKYQIILVLKSSDTIIATPYGKILVNIEGSPALAKGGSGDCLTGLITGLISQGYSLEDAAVLACFIMGRTAKILASKHNENTILTTDVINNLWMSLNEIRAYQQEPQRYRKNCPITI
jgi:NAD(P)H-hydrate epimerase